MPSLALFPLQTVLVPGDVVQLRIFERRYVVLLRDVLREREQQRGAAGEFGIVSLAAGQEVGEHETVRLHDVGCSGVLEQVSEAEKGTFLVQVRGKRRFRLDGIDAEARTPYHVGFVTWLTDRCRDTELVTHLAARLRAEVARYREQFGLEPVDFPDDPEQLSHVACGHVALDATDRQALLEARDVDTRLRLGITLVRREAVLQRELMAFPGRFTIAEPVPN